jgi:hypothetical protein
MGALLLTEEQHRSFLNLFLGHARRLKEDGRDQSIQKIAPYARDCLNIVRDIGYFGLYKEFKPLYDTAGL